MRKKPFMEAIASFSGLHKHLCEYVEVVRDRLRPVPWSRSTLQDGCSLFEPMLEALEHERAVDFRVGARSSASFHSRRYFIHEVRPLDDAYLHSSVKS